MLKLIPFTCTMDILFRHGGMTGLQRIYPGAWLFEFIRRAFGESEWSEIVCACHLVFSLQTPAHALYLLHPMDRTIPDSVDAWTVSSRHSDASWILPVRRDLMIRAMKAFLPRGKVYDWLDSSDMVSRSTEQWVAFALECIYCYRFTARWWARVGRLDGDTMEEVRSYANFCVQLTNGGCSGYRQSGQRRVGAAGNGSFACCAHPNAAKQEGENRGKKS